MSLPFQGDHWLPGFNFNVEEWDAKGLHYETLAICRSSVARRGQSREKRHVRGEPERYELCEELASFCASHPA